MIKQKDNKGLTLIETLVAITLLTALISSFIYTMTHNAKLKQEMSLSNSITLVADGVGKRIESEFFRYSTWDTVKWEGNKELFNTLIAKELRSKDSSCGLPDGWDSSLTGHASFEAVPCTQLNKVALPFLLDSNSKIEMETVNDVEIVSNFNVDIFFKNDKDFKSNFKHLSGAKNKLDYKSGPRYYKSISWVNRTNNNTLSLNECIQAASNCALQVNIESFDLMSSDKLRIDGSNSMMAEVDFDNSANNCQVWTKTDSLWGSETADCGIKGGFDSVNGRVLARLNGVSLDERLSLNRMCNFYGAGGFSSTQFSCGIFKEKIITLGSTNNVVFSVNGVNAFNSVSEILVTDDQRATVKNVSRNLDVTGRADIELLQSAKSVYVKNKVDGGLLSSVNTDKIIQDEPAINQIGASSKASDFSIKNEAGEAPIGSFVLVKEQLNISGDYLSDKTFSAVVNSNYYLNDLNKLSPYNATWEVPFLGSSESDTPIRVTSVSPSLQPYFNGGMDDRPYGPEDNSRIGSSVTIDEFHSGKNGNRSNTAYNIGGVNQFGVTNTKLLDLTKSGVEVTSTGKTDARLVQEYGTKGSGGYFDNTNPTQMELNVVKEGLSLTSEVGSVLKANSINVKGTKTGSKAPNGWENSVVKRSPNTLSVPQVVSTESTVINNGDIVVKKAGVEMVKIDRNGLVSIPRTGGFHIGANGGGNFGGFQSYSSYSLSNETPNIDKALHIKGDFKINVKNVQQFVPFYNLGKEWSAPSICDGGDAGPKKVCLRSIYQNHQDAYNSYVKLLKHEKIFKEKLSKVKKGPTGNTGPKGFRGPTGDAGPDGSRGPLGPRGPMAYKSRD